MTLIVRIEAEVKAAMLSHDGDRRDALRLILNSLKNAEKDLQDRKSTRLNSSH